ncbi:hypothetical protein C8R47DRAFT_517153 [Mycena vitilis]|nr:hypothetical protein C8R47DRAFT_517153 [Mycena vitilis]
MDSGMLPSSLPVQEMWDQIIDELNTRTDLQSCSLTCRAFAARAQSHIFRRIAIRQKRSRDAKTLAKELADIIATSPHLISYIRILYLEGCDQDVLYPLVRIRWSHLEDLTLSSSGQAFDLENICILVQLPSIRSLAIIGEQWETERIHHIFCHCNSRLERVEFWHCNPPPTSFSPSHSGAPAPKIRHLVMVASGAISGVLLEYPLLMDFSELTHIRCSRSMDGALSSFLIQHCANLESLHLGGADAGIDALDLGLFPALKYLTCSDMGSAVNEMLKSIPANNIIDTIRVSTFGPGLTMDIIRDFQATILALTMPMLRHVDVEVHSSPSPFLFASNTTGLPKMLRHHLSKLEERGLLSPSGLEFRLKPIRHELYGAPRNLMSVSTVPRRFRRPAFDLQSCNYQVENQEDAPKMSARPPNFLSSQVTRATLSLNTKPTPSSELKHQAAECTARKTIVERSIDHVAVQPPRDLTGALLNATMTTEGQQWVHG